MYDRQDIIIKLKNYIRPVELVPLGVSFNVFQWSSKIFIRLINELLRADSTGRRQCDFLRR